MYIYIYFCFVHVTVSPIVYTHTWTIILYAKRKDDVDITYIIQSYRIRATNVECSILILLP